jgi:hypothetical protein
VVSSPPIAIWYLTISGANLSSESLCWERPETNLTFEKVFAKLKLSWDLYIDRRTAFELSQENGYQVHEWLKGISDEDALFLGFYKQAGPRTFNNRSGTLRPFEVHSVRPVRRIGPDGQQRTDLTVEITQSWISDDGGGKFRGGCTLVVDLGTHAIRYVVRKRVGHKERLDKEQQYRMHLAEADLGSNYFGDDVRKREPFAMLHRGI